MGSLSINFYYLLLSLFLCVQTALASEFMPVFYPTTLSAKGRQDVLKSGLQSADMDVVVFAKFRDFIEEVSRRSPSILIAPSSFSKFYPGYKPVFKFSGDEGSQFNYLLLALSPQWNASNLGEGKAGAIEEVSFEHLKGYLADLISASPKIVKSVSKAEDLFPLLVFKSADYILISPSNYERLKEQFSVKVFNVAKSKSVANPMVFVRDGAVSGPSLLNGIRSLPATVLNALGFAKVENFGGAK